MAPHLVRARSAYKDIRIHGVGGRAGGGGGGWVGGCQLINVWLWTPPYF